MIPCYDEAKPAQQNEDLSEKFLKVIEKLELRLACSKLKENNLLDKIALLCEEKKRLVVDAFKGEASMVDEYLVIERDLNSIECSLDRDASLNDVSINEDSFNEVSSENHDENTDDKDENDEEINPVEARKVAAKLKRKMHFEKSREGVQWIEECLRLDTPTKQEYTSLNQGYSGENDNAYLHHKVSEFLKVFLIETFTFNIKIFKLFLYD